MSGIAGLYNLDGRPVDGDLLARMTDLIAYRGPDGGGCWQHGPVGLGQRMLCTTPEALAERQPWCDAAGEYCLVLDGRVDNRAELRAALLAAGARLRNDTDAELVLQAYLAWGAACPQRIIGDFAFAIWDGPRRQLFCARDAIGVRPFYYHCDEHTFRFGSELRQCLCDPAVRRRPNEGMIGEYLASAITSHTETLYQGIMRLAPAHYLIVRDGRVSTARWWDLAAIAPLHYRSDEEYAEHFLALFQQSVRAQLRSNGPVGVALSGGLDSSAIACVAQALRQAGDTSVAAIEAFSELYPGRACDERQYIQDVVTKWGLVSHTVDRTTLDISAHAQQAARYLDFPDYPNGGIASPLAGMARARGMRVLLNGSGGDEWLTGSNYHYADLLASGQLAEVGYLFSADLHDYGTHYACSQLAWSGLNPLLTPSLRTGLKRLLGRQNATPAWIDREFAVRIDLGARLRSARERLPQLGFAANDIYRVATNGFQLHAVEIEERAAAITGIERRMPFHNQRLIEFALAIPERQRNRTPEIKYVLRQALRDYLPESIRHRQDKADFSHLFAAMFAHPWAEQILQNSARTAMGWVDAGEVRRLYQEMCASAAQPNVEYIRHIWPLWMILGIKIWFTATFLDQQLLSYDRLHIEFPDRPIGVGA